MSNEKHSRRNYIKPVNVAIASILSSINLESSASTNLNNQPETTSPEEADIVNVEDTPPQLIINPSDSTSDGTNSTANHYSHQSHSSHYSHRSHYSGY